MKRSGEALRLCLAASGGGHVRQLLDLEAAWSKHDHYFVSEETALTRSIAQKHRTHFVAHMALGQARLEGPLKLITAALRNFVQSLQIAWRERPDVVITTGAGTVFFTVLFARLAGARIVLIESFARFHAPSKFGRLVAPLAHQKIAQSAALAAYWPDAEVFDPLRVFEEPPPPKQPLCLVTVGAILPFPRLVEMAVAAKAAGEIPERMVVQTGEGSVATEGIETVATLGYDEMQQLLREAEIVICHGGTGSLITALRQGCRVVAVPRLLALGEVYDDHQAEITHAFAERGLIEVANTLEELSVALRKARSRPPLRATTDHARLIEFLAGLLRAPTAEATHSRPDPLAPTPLHAQE
ncbi:MAG TPA: glycosyltransferase [Caulobacteraceae bacterium]|nr:glycosyltransferase [Caulobacteraceae bacterium]